MKTVLDYLKELLEIDSPTGYTQAVEKYLLRTLTDLGYAPKHHPKGNISVRLQGSITDKERYVTAHVDTLGAIVKAIKPDGRLKLDRIGGYPWNMIEGENCRIYSARTEKVHSGTILIHQTSTHVYKDAGTAERTYENMEIRLDEKVRTANETEALGIGVGDFVSFAPRVTITDTGFVKSRFLDDKVSAAILLYLLDRYQADKTLLPVTTEFAFSVFEEVGHGANSSLNDNTVEYVAVDMGAMGDDQATDEYTVSICAKDATGPYHYAFRQHLVKLATDNHIPYQLDIYPYYGSDASAALRAGADVKHALFGAGIESSHSYERTHIESIEATTNLLACYLQSDLVANE